MTPSSQSASVTVLWARSRRFPMPQFVGAWGNGLVESWPECYFEQRKEAEGFFSGFGDGDDGPWTFWTTVETIPQPSEAEAARAVQEVHGVAS